MNAALHSLRGAFGPVASFELEASVTEAPWGKDHDALRSFDVDIVRFDEHIAGAAYVTAGLTAPGSLQKQVGAAPYEIAFCLPSPSPWAPRLLAQLSVGYALTRLDSWAWRNLTKCAASMAASLAVPRALREPYDGLGFVRYRPSGMATDAPRIRLAVGIERHEMVLTEAKLVASLNRFGFWPATPATRDNVVDLAERYVPRPAKRAEAAEAAEGAAADDARALLEWLVEMGEIIVEEGALGRVAERMRPRFTKTIERFSTDHVPEAASIVVAWLEQDKEVAEVFLGDPARRELERWLYKVMDR